MVQAWDHGKIQHANGVLQKFVSDLLSRFPIPGLACLIDVPGGHLQAVDGLASARNPQPLTAKHRLPLSCVIKPLVALVCHHLVERGELDLEEDIARYLPELSAVPGEATGIRVRHLLSHTAGYVEPTADDIRWNWNWERFCEYFQSRTQAFPPGKVWSYTHTGFVIVAQLLERITGETMESLLNYHIFGPLGIQPMPLQALVRIGAPTVSLHIMSPRTLRFEPMSPPKDNGFLRYSISDLCLSPEDILTIGQFLAGKHGALLPELEGARKSLLVEQTRVPQFIGEKNGEVMPTAYASGVAAYGALNGVNGSYVGSTVALRFIPKTGVNFVVALNAWAPPMRDGLVRFISRFFATSVSLNESISLPPGFRADDLVGDYRGLMLGTDHISVVKEGAILKVIIHRPNGSSDSTELEVSPSGKVRFSLGARETALSVARVPDGSALYLMAGTSAFMKVN